MSNSLWPYGMHKFRLPFSLSPSICSNSCPLNQWCHPTISSCHPLLLLPPIFSSIRVFSNELALHISWPKYWSFSIRPSSEYSVLISFKIDWFDLLAVWRINAFQPALVSTNNRIWQKQWYITSKTKLWKLLWLLSWSFCVCVFFPKSFFLSHITCSRKSQLPQHGQYKGQVHLSRNWGHVSDLGGRYLQPQPWWL